MVKKSFHTTAVRNQNRVISICVSICTTTNFNVVIYTLILHTDNRMTNHYMRAESNPKDNEKLFILKTAFYKMVYFTRNILLVTFCLQ